MLILAIEPTDCMIGTNWLKHTNDPELQRAAHEKIVQIQMVEQLLPAVVIIHNLADDSIVYLSERGRNYLNVTLEQVRLPHFAYHKRFFNPADVPNYVPKILAMLQRNNDEEMVSYFQQVRPSETAPWKWFSSSSKILLRDEQQKPLLGITIAVPIDEAHFFTPKIERLVQENTFLRENGKIFSSLSKREKEVLKYLSLGNNSLEIAEKLHIAEATVKTHRKNIRSKLNAESNYDLLQFAQAFNLI